MGIRRTNNYAASIAAIITTVLLVYTFVQSNRPQSSSSSSSSAAPYAAAELIVVTVSCGRRQSETLNLLKTAIAFNRPWTPLRFIIFTESDKVASFRRLLEHWTTLSNTTAEHHTSFTFEIRALDFPQQHASEWRQLFKPCAAQRLFLPTILADIDAVLYMDTDTLFLSPANRLWSHFEHFNGTQMVGLAAEHLDASVGWYNHHAKHPFYGELGVNSGVMLMNLTRMRAFRWEAWIVPLFEAYKDRIVWGDQDLINILFHEHPDKLYELPCDWNYRPDHCRYETAHWPTGHAVGILHGNHGTFHTAKQQPLFEAVYRVIDAYMPGADVRQTLLEPLERAISTDETVRRSMCSRISDALLFEARRLLK